MKGIKESLAKVLFTAAAGVSILAVALICIFLFASGVPAIGKIGVVEFLTGTVWRPASETFGILPMILGSIYATLGALVIGVPTGLFCAVYLSRFASPRVKRIVTPGVELLAGIPSVIYGFFGLVVLVPLSPALSRAGHEPACCIHYLGRDDPSHHYHGRPQCA